MKGSSLFAYARTALRKQNIGADIEGGSVVMYSVVSIMVAGFLIAAPLMAQNAEPASSKPQTTLQVTSRAVLVDVIVSDRKGHPVTGLRQDAFTVTEQGKRQSISFFEEHAGAAPAQSVEIPKLPPNTFSNFSPFPAPDAVNVLLLDSLNTRMESQSFMHKQAVKFLKNSKPGSRMAIFTMGLGLHFVQGFTDDPALLMAALNDKKNNEVQTSVMIKGQEETNAQTNLVGMMQAPNVSGSGSSASPGMITALMHFLAEQDTSQKYDRGLVTLTNLQRLATFLTAFPGRKNVIWFMESFPPLTAMEDNPKLAGDYKKTMNMLAAARVAIYPVDARGVATIGFYQADNQLPSSNTRPYQIIGVDNNPGSASASAPGDSSAPPTPNAPGGQVSGLLQESQDRNSDQMMQQMFAEDSGGKAFANTNGLAEVIGKIASNDSDFYTLSYTPTNSKMDGGFRKIEVNVAGGYTLSYRRGYYAEDAGLPGAALTERNQEIQKLAAENPGAVDPLLPFMDLGMPQSTQIVYKTHIQIVPATNGGAAGDAAKKQQSTYRVDFFINLNDIEFTTESNGNHAGKLNLSLIAYDRYGNIANRRDHIVNIDIKPDVYAIFQKTGIQLHDSIGVPKGQFWLRTGIYDEATQKVGTLETPLSAVKDLTEASK